jgi:HAD superfamily hydrolase (TIGR01509 family)
VRELLLEADRDGIPCAVASSSQRSHVSRWLRRTGLEGAFAAVLTRDDVARAKPFPDLFLGAAAALGVAPRDALVLEDSRNGLRAALAAAVPCVVVPSPVTRGSDFAGAAAILETLREVTPGVLASIHRSVPD